MHLAPTMIACRGCGLLVESRSRNPRKWCSQTCRARAYEKARGYTSHWPVSAVSFRDCETCGLPFLSRHAAIVCSSDCRTQLWRDRERERVAALTAEKVAHRLSVRREAAARRRARQRGASAEPFSEWEVFARDDWVCGLCGEAIDPTAVHPDPRRASLDHIIPLSRGGEHSLANSAATHLSCNIRRGNRPVGEVDAV